MPNHKAYRISRNNNKQLLHKKTEVHQRKARQCIRRALEALESNKPPEKIEELLVKHAEHIRQAQVQHGHTLGNIFKRTLV